MSLPQTSQYATTYANGISTDVTNLYDPSNSTTSSMTSQCATGEPTSQQFLSNLSSLNICLLVVICGFAILSLVIYVDEIVFLLRNFPSGGRRNKTIWLLAYFPVFSVTAMLSVLVPRSSTLVDIVANTFFATCLFQFLGLIQNYLGGREVRMRLVDESRLLTLNTAPLCCFFVCLPKVPLTRKKFRFLQLTILQFTIIRPVLMFIAGVLWTNGSYVAGYMSASSAFLYIAILNLLCTLLAMYGLTLIKGYFQSELEPRFRMTYKVGCIQLSLIFSLLPKLIVSILIGTKIITCTESLTPKTRSEVIYHAILTIIMPLFAILGRLAFRRRSDALDVLPGSTPVPVYSITGATSDDSSDKLHSTDSVSSKSSNDEGAKKSNERNLLNDIVFKCRKFRFCERDAYYLY